MSDRSRVARARQAVLDGWRKWRAETRLSHSHEPDRRLSNSLKSREILTALVAFLIIAVASKASAQNICYTREEYLAIAASNYFLSQAISSAKCDALIEGVETPIQRSFIKKNNQVYQTHKKTIEGYTDPLGSVAAKHGAATVGEYLAARTVQIAEWIDASGFINRENCSWFYEELGNRENSWPRIMAGFVTEYLALEDEDFCESEP